MATLPLYYNRQDDPCCFAEVSDEDISLLEGFSWKVATGGGKSPRSIRARAHVRGLSLFLHQSVGMLVIHGALAEVALEEALRGDPTGVRALLSTMVRIIPSDGDYLNCTRENLRPSLAYKFMPDVARTFEIALSKTEREALEKKHS